MSFPFIFPQMIRVSRLDSIYFKVAFRIFVDYNVDNVLMISIISIKADHEPDDAFQTDCSVFCQVSKIIFGVKKFLSFVHQIVVANVALYMNVNRIIWL